MHSSFWRLLFMTRHMSNNCRITRGSERRVFEHIVYCHSSTPATISVWLFLVARNSSFPFNLRTHLFTINLSVLQVERRVFHLRPLWILSESSQKSIFHLVSADCRHQIGRQLNIINRSSNTLRYYVVLHSPDDELIFY